MSNAINLHAFHGDLAKFSKLLDVAPKVVMQRLVLDLHTRISKRTPVDTGRARASWDVKEGSTSSYIPPATKGTVAGKGKTKVGKGLAGNALGAGALSGGKAKDVGGEIAAITGTRPVFITSALDYMQYLEKGSSKQAPAGMVRLSLAEVEIEVEDIIGQLDTKQ